MSEVGCQRSDIRRMKEENPEIRLQISKEFFTAEIAESAEDAENSFSQRTRRSLWLRILLRDFQAESFSRGNASGRRLWPASAKK
jgi:hypothetical protein